MSAITAKQLELVLGRQTVLSQVDFTVRRGEFVALVGPSGCGKTSLLRMVAGLVRPSRGELALGEPAASVTCPPRRAFVFQDPTLLPWRDALANVRLPLELQAVARDAATRAAAEALELVGLAGADQRKLPRMLSGGMRMRVSLARALVTRPEILLLDEPFAALDDLLRQRLNEELLALWSEQRWTALFVTHNVAEAVFLSQRVLVLGSGPRTIHAEVPVTLAYPRDEQLRGEPDFARLCGTVSQWLRRSA